MDTFIPTPDACVRTAARQDATRPQSQEETVVIIRPSFKKICGNDPCQAALFNQLFYQLACKAQYAQPQTMRQGEVYFYKSAEEIRTDLLAESWSVNKIRQEITRLVASGLIGQRNNPANQWDQTYFYFFGEQQADILVTKCQEQHVCLIHLDLPEKMLHTLRIVNAFTKFGECICQKEVIDTTEVGHRIHKNVAAITKNPTKILTKKEDKEDSFVVSAKAETDGVGVASLLSKLSSFEECLEDVQHQENGHTNGKAPLDLSPSTKEEVRQEELLEVDTLPEPATSEPTEEMSTEPLTELPTQQREIPVLSILTVSPEDNGETPSPDKTDGKGDSKTFEQREAKQLAIRQNKRKKIIREAGFTEEQERTYEKWETFYHERCGGAPVEERAFYADVNTLVKLVKKFSDRQLGMLDTYFTKEHFKWKQPTWQHQLGAMRVWEEHQSAIAYLTSKGRWADGCGVATSPPDDSFSCIPEGYNAADEFAEYYGINEKREGEHAAL